MRSITIKIKAPLGITLCNLKAKGYIIVCMIKTIIDQLKKSFKNKPGVVATYLIGSFASSNTSKESDFDLAVIVEDKKKTTLDDVYKLIQSISFPADPDLSPLFLYQIISRGKRLYARAEKKVIDFEAKVLDKYYDTQHIRLIYYSYLKDKFPKHAS